MKYLKQFEDIRIFGSKNHKFQRGAAITIPGIGIFIGEKHAENIDLLRHEYGHILQRKQKGFLFFWCKIAPASLKSAMQTSKDKSKVHMHTWTEWSANKLSFEYFNRPTDWNFTDYPITPHNQASPQSVKQQN